MYNCSHCGSKIDGKYTEVSNKGAINIMFFHANPADCYIKEAPLFFHKRETTIMKEIVLAGGAEW